MTDAAHICALKCIAVPVQCLSNALSLVFLFYYLQSPQPFTSNPWKFKLRPGPHVCLFRYPSVAMSVCLVIF